LGKQRTLRSLCCGHADACSKENLRHVHIVLLRLAAVTIFSHDAGLHPLGYTTGVNAVTPDELSVRQQELEIQRANVFIEFAKYRFAGTLTAAIMRLVLIVGLATLSAFTAFKIETWGWFRLPA
jgi:hypothetical protein